MTEDITKAAIALRNFVRWHTEDGRLCKNPGLEWAKMTDDGREKYRTCVRIVLRALGKTFTEPKP